MNKSQSLHLPVTHDLRQAYVFSIIIAILVGVASVAGLAAQDAVYPTEELRRSFVSNDVVNLLIGLPILLGSIALARGGRLAGLLFWPGALFYILYNYIVYVFAMPLSGFFWLYLTLVILSIYTMGGLVASMNGGEIRDRLSGAVAEKFGGGVKIVGVSGCGM